MVSGNCPSKAWETFRRGLEEVQERFERGLGGVQEMFGRGRERNGLVIREEIGQLGKQEEQRKKVVSRSRQRGFLRLKK